MNLIVYVTMIGIIGSVTYVGYELKTLAFGMVIFFCAMLTLAMFLNKKYLLLWGLLSTTTLILYTIWWKDSILIMVPTIFLYYGYIFTYIVGILFTYFLVSATSSYFDSIHAENEDVIREKNLKNVFWANISNEIRTPMNVINGMSKLLKMESINARAREYTDQIENASEMLLTIVYDTMELSHIETGDFHIKNDFYDIYKLAHLSVMESSSNIHSSKVNIAYCINPKLPNVLRGDSEVLQKVVTRLLNNALIFTETGEVRLELDMNEVSKTLIELVITVKDSCTELKESDIKNLFANFDTKDLNRTTEQETVGLSLKLCKSFVDALKGTISINVNKDKGIVYTVKLVQEIGNESLLTTNDDVDISFENDTFNAPDSCVLVVDDTPTNLKLITGMIKLHGVETDGAESGKEAIAKMAEKKYNLVFIDYMMPDMNGSDTLKQIKSKNEVNFSDAILIAMTSKTLQRDRAKFMDMGFDEFISKPIDDNELLNILKRFL